MYDNRSFYEYTYNFLEEVSFESIKIEDTTPSSVLHALNIFFNNFNSVVTPYNHLQKQRSVPDWAIVNSLYKIWQTVLYFESRKLFTYLKT